MPLPVPIQTPPPPFFSSCVQEMGVIGPNNQVSRKRADRGALYSALSDNEEDLWTENGLGSHAKTDKQSELHLEADTSKVLEALSLFPKPKSLLTTVIQVATSSNKIKVCSSNPFHIEVQAVLVYSKHFLV